MPSDMTRDAAPLRVSVDLNLCQAYAQCCYAAPRHFRIDGREALFYDPAPSAADRLDIERARLACPVHTMRCTMRAAERQRTAAHNPAL